MFNSRKCIIYLFTITSELGKNIVYLNTLKHEIYYKKKLKFKTYYAQI